MEKRIGRIALVLVVMVCGLVAGWYLMSGPRKPQPLVLELDYGLRGYHSPFFVAIDKGYYSDEGLNVTVEVGTGSGNTIKSVQLGKADFGWADISTLMLLRANDPTMDVKAISQTVQRHALVCVYIDGRGIVKPSDLEGKKISGGGAAELTTILIPGALTLMGVNPDTVQIVHSSGETKNVMLARGDVDAIFDLPWDPSTQEAAENYGIPEEGVRYFRVSDYGLEAYMQAIVTSARMINEKADVVRGFVRASLKAYRYSMEHPEEAVDILIKYHPEVPRDIAEYHIEAQMKDWVSPDVESHGLGYISRDMVNKTRTFVVQNFKPTGTVPAIDDIYTDEFWTSGIMPPS